MIATIFKRIIPMVATLLLLCTTACSGGTSTNVVDGKLPKQMSISVYSVGSGTYNDVAAMAEAITKAEGTRFRLIPSDTGIGRLTPLKNKTAEFARLGEEYIYAFEGDLDFAVKDWGPQDLRMVWAATGPIGLGVAEDGHIKKLQDLKGKRLPKITANPSVNNKLDAYLALAGLNATDVTQVDVGYSEQGEALKSGKIDAVIYNPYASQMTELNSAKKIKWLDAGSPNKDRLAHVKRIAPSVEIKPFQNGAGMKEGESVVGVNYATPIVTYADTDPALVDVFIKAIVENFDSYKSTTVTTQSLDIDEVQTDPLVVPFHDGAIEYLKDKGKWSDIAEQHNKDLLERGRNLQNGWKDVVDDSSDETIAEEWKKWKETNVSAP